MNANHRRTIAAPALECSYHNKSPATMQGFRRRRASLQAQWHAPNVLPEFRLSTTKSTVQMHTAVLFSHCADIDNRSRSAARISTTEVDRHSMSEKLVAVYAWCHLLTVLSAHLILTPKVTIGPDLSQITNTVTLRRPFGGGRFSRAAWPSPRPPSRLRPPHGSSTPRWNWSKLKC